MAKQPSPKAFSATSAPAALLPTGMIMNHDAEIAVLHASQPLPLPHHYLGSMKADVMHSIIDLIRKVKLTGVPAALQTLRDVMSTMRADRPTHDDDFTFVESWRKIRQGLKAMWSGGVRGHFKEGTVFSCRTSLQQAGSADDIREWIETMFATGNKFILEPPRNTLGRLVMKLCRMLVMRHISFSLSTITGAVFIDDLHLCIPDISESTAASSQLYANRPEALLLGLLDSQPSFGLKRTGLDDTKGKSLFACSDSVYMEHEAVAMPLLHRSALSDPKTARAATDHVDDYLVSRLSIMCGASGNAEDLLRCDGIQQLAGKLSLVSMLPMNALELHTSLINGSMQVLIGETIGSTQAEAVRTQVFDLSRITVDIARQLFRRIDDCSSPVEKNLIPMITLNARSVSQLCCMLAAGSQASIASTDKGGLLHLWLHEWQCIFVDPLPACLLREKTIALMQKQLDAVELERWGVSNEWMQTRLNELGALREVWSSMPTQTDGCPGRGYRPMSTLMRVQCFTDGCDDGVELNGADSSIDSIAIISNQQNAFLSLTEDIVSEIIVADSESMGLPLVPASCALLMQLVRVLSLPSGSHICLPSQAGMILRPLVQLAGQICGSSLNNYEIIVTL